MADHECTISQLAEMDQRHSMVRDAVNELTRSVQIHNSTCSKPLCDMAYMVHNLIQSTLKTGDIMPVCEIAAYLLCERAKAPNRKDFPL